MCLCVCVCKGTCSPLSATSFLRHALFATDVPCRLACRLTHANHKLRRFNKRRIQIARRDTFTKRSRPMPPRLRKVSSEKAGRQGRGKKRSRNRSSGRHNLMLFRARLRHRRAAFNIVGRGSIVPREFPSNARAPSVVLVVVVVVAQAQLIDYYPSNREPQSGSN